MVVTTRPRRSMLFMPGQNGRALAKAASLAVDGVILDLEDGTAPAAKAAARRAVVERVRDGGLAPREVLVRINGLDTPWGSADLEAVATIRGIDGIVLPKIESVEAFRDVEGRLDALGAPPDLALWSMVETPLGVLNVRDIAAAGGRLAGLIMGTADLAKDLHAAVTAERLELMVSLGTCLIAARAHGLPILDGVFTDLNDGGGLARVCRQGADLGFDGKTLIHPGQIEAANHAFSPSPADVAQAQRLIDAHAEAHRQGRGVAVVDGRLVENLHVANAKRLVDSAAAIARLQSVFGQTGR